MAATETQAYVPPQNLEAEEQVLGAMMVNQPAITKVMHEVGLRGEDFYRDRHRTIFEAIRQLDLASEPVDAITVSEILLRDGALEDVGGRDRISALVASVAAPGNARHYAEIVQHNALLRRLVDAAQEIQQSVRERSDEPKQLAENAERLLFNVAHEEHASDFRKVADVLKDEVEKLETLSKGDATVTGTPSGFRELDSLTGGFQPQNLIIIAARPSMGKSSLVSNIAENVATKHNAPVAFFSLEMSEAELAQRFIGCRARIPSDKLRKGRVSQKDWPRVLRACNELDSAPLWIDDSADLGMLDLRAKARRLHSSVGGLGLIIVDYLQLMRAEDPRQNRVEQVAQISRGLKILAKELDVPVIGISQLSRAPEQRPDKRPILSDLRESGQIEQDADLVAFIYRDEYYNHESEDQGLAEIIIAKHRNGPTGIQKLVFLETYPRFVDRAREDKTIEAKAGEGPALQEAVEESS